MAVCSKYHKELTNGVGKCSVPMWCNGVPAGFCDEPAFGEQTEKGKRRYTDYAPYLACLRHGGPKSRVENIVVYLIPDDPNNDRVQKELGKLSDVKISEIICPPGVRDLYRMPFITDGKGGRHFGVEGVDRFVRNKINLLIEFTNLLHKHGSPDAPKVKEFLEAHKHDITFYRRAKTVILGFETLGGTQSDQKDD